MTEGRKDGSVETKEERKKCTDEKKGGKEERTAGRQAGRRN